MKSDDPNFPQEISPIPEARDNLDSSHTIEAESVDEGETVNPAESDIGSEGADRWNEDDGIQNEGFPADREQADHDPAVDVQGAFLTAKPAEDKMPETAKPPVKQPRATDTTQREAEKPVSTHTSYDDWGQSEVPYQPKALGIIDQLLLLLADGAAGWRRVLRWTRSQLPPAWQRRLSDEIMTAMLLGLFMLILALWNPIGAGKTTGSVAEQPSPSPSAEARENAPAAPMVEEETPAIASGIDSLPESPPEQGLIADIQAKVSDISRAYAAGLIQSVEVNLPENQLIVNLGESWYGLLQTQQDQVSQHIYEQVQQLDFKTLQFRDPNGVMVARNPVVGNRMVILRRSRSSDLVLS